MADLWTQPNNYLLRTLVERISIGEGDLTLPLSTTQDVTVTLISGKLPVGMRVLGTDLIGTPVEEVRETEYTFVLRAKTPTQLQDRTFKLRVTGEDDPRWVTNPGLLPVGRNGLLFILDNEIIDFNLRVIDPDLPAGDQLHFYIEPGDGVLPPGIKLTPDGRLQGVVEPLLALDKRASQGGYDTTRYDNYPLDYSIRSDSGFSSFFYDTVEFDFNFPTRVPRKLNRYYEFAVHVADTTSPPVRRKFKIYVVADDFLKADNTIMKVANGVFTADNIDIRTPQWITPPDLGFVRADNNVTIYLDTLEAESLEGRVLYSKLAQNPDETESVLPPGTQLSSTTGEITGTIPTQPAVTREYTFTVLATRFTTDTDFAVVTLQVFEDTRSGGNSFKVFKLPVGVTNDGIDDLNDLRGRELVIRNNRYIVDSVDGSNNAFDVITLRNTLKPNLLITISDDVTSPTDQFYIDRINYSESQRWQDRQIIYSTNETYTVERIHPYIELEITSASGSISIDYVAAGVEPPQGNETLASAINRIFGNELLPVEIISSTANTVRFIAPVTKSTAGPRLREIFDEGTGTNDLVFSVINNNRSLVQLDQDLLLTRSFAAGDTIGLSIFEDDVIEKELITDANTDITNPSSARTFTINVLGEVDSVITWQTPADLGQLTANFTSTLNVEAETTVPDARLIYSLVDGQLPNGLRLSYRGEIIGKARQFASDTELGLTRIDGGNTTFDSTTFDMGLTTFDRVFTFTVKAEDRFGFSATTREFTIEIVDLDATLYSNLYLQPFLKQTQRTEFTRFINDPEVFPPNDIYRPNDPNFGLQTNIRILAYAGIESKAINEFVAAAAKNHKRRRYTLGDVKHAVAKNPGTNDTVYELVYIEVIDPADSKKGETQETFGINNTRDITSDTTAYSAKDIEDQEEREKTNIEPFRFRNGNRLQGVITADSDGPIINQQGDVTRYLSNTTNMQKQIEKIGKTQRDYLPLWMRTGQDNSIQELGFITAIPLAYCKEGRGKDVLLNVQNALRNGEFDFKQLDLDIDRYILDGALDVDDERYILFANYQFNE